MTEYDDTNKGALFVNDKQGNDKRPDFRGRLNVGGAEFWLSAWKEKSKKGVSYLSLRVQPAETAEGKEIAKKPEEKPAEPDPFTFDDPIPF